MAIGALIPLLVFVLVAGGVGVRLVRMWRRTRAAPEMLLGFGLAIVAAGMPFAAAGRVPAIALEPLGRSLFALGLTANMTGVCLMFGFTYAVFRRDVGWAKALLAILCAVELGAVAFICWNNFTGASVPEIKLAMRPGTLALLAGVLLSYIWSALESFAYRVTLRRRQRALGLGDPVVENRFLLWGVASTTSAAMAGALLACVQLDMTILREPLPLSMMAGCGTVMSAAWYLTFFAPAPYLRLVRRRAADDQNS